MSQFPPSGPSLTPAPSPPGEPGSRSRTRSFSLSREGLIWLGVSVVLGFCGWYKNINLLLLMAYVMFGVVIVNAVLAWGQVRYVTARRRLAAPAFSGEVFTVAADVTSRHGRPVSVQVRHGAGRAATWWFVPQLRPGETRRAVAERVARRRGRYPLPPLHVQCGDPFGLIRYQLATGPAGESVILPAVGKVDLTGLRRWLIRTGAGDAKTRRPVRRPGLHHADVRGVRPYRPGDGMKEIHWRTTARRNELAVREYDSTEPLDLVLVIDAWVSARRTETERRNLEWAVSLAASVCWAWALADEAAELTLVVPGGTPAVQTIRADRSSVRHALAPLADVRGGPVTPAIPSNAVRLRSNRSARLVVSSRPGNPLGGTLRAATGVPFVPIDPTLAPVWYRPPGDAGAES
jgi:uncharacterized protein (DUF58 family)